MKLTRRGRIWRVEWVDDRGERQRRSTGETDKAAAQKAAARLMAGETVSRRPAATEGSTLRAWLHRTYESVWKDSRSASTFWVNIGTVCKDRIAELPVAAVTHAELKAYAARCREAGSSPGTVNRRLSLISKALGEAVKDGAIAGRPPMPMQREPKGKEVYLTEAQEAALLAAAKTLPSVEGALMLALLEFLLDTGARLGEALRLTRDDYDRASVLFRETKNGKPRRVPLTARAAYAADVLTAPGWGVALTKDWCEYRFGRLRRVSGLPDAVTLHTLRHTCASRLIQRGADLYRVKEWLGHSSITVTERYAHLCPSRLDDMAALLAPGGATGRGTGPVTAHSPAHERHLSKQDGEFRWNLNPETPVEPS
jgi:integrase